MQRDSLARTRLRAAWMLRLENGWPFLLPALAALCGFAVLAELALPQKLPLWLHAMLALGLAAYACSRLWHVLRRMPPPSADAIDRRIEQRSGLRHRPLQTLADRPAGSANAARDAVWQEHRARTGLELGRLRAGAPRLDPWRYPAGRLTLSLLGLLALSWIAAGSNAPNRLASGFLPGLFASPGPLPRMQAWITPPDYARTAPVFLTDPRGTVDMPAGSVLQVSLTGLEGAPRLRIDNLDPAHPPTGAAPRFRRLSRGSWSLAAPLDASIRLSLRGNGRFLADWTLRIAPLPPSTLAWDGKPSPSREAWRTSLPWHASDPYGLDRLTVAIRLAKPDRNAGAPSTPPLRVTIPLEAGTREARGTALPDLSADPRAGEPVLAELTAIDNAGHRIRSPDAGFILPSRPFRSPLARAVLDTRKRLALGRESRVEAAGDLEALGGAPGQFASDSGLFLNLASVVALLRDEDATDADAVNQSTGRLWELALALEDGLHDDRTAARASADVRAARQAVGTQLEHMRALGDKGQSGHEQAELERRIQALAKAIARRMQALAREAARQHTVLPPMPDTKMLSGGDLARMMQQMRDDAAHGDTRSAMHRLTQMQAMLDRMRAATPRDLREAQAQAQARRQAREQADGLRDLVRRESALLDETQARLLAQQKAEREQAPPGIDPQTAELLRRLGIPPNEVDAAPSAGDETPPNPSENSAADAQALAHRPDQAAPPAPDPAQARAQALARQQGARVQHALGRALGGLGEEFQALSGKQPGGFGEAGKAMDQARQALAAGQDQPARQAQEQALAALQKGESQMRRILSSGAGAAPMLMPGMADGSGGGSPGDEPDAEQSAQDAKSGPRDPLGRPSASGAQADDGDTHVPDKIDQMRARAIEQELRKRDSDRTRPPQELDYLGRLLTPF